MDGAPPVSPAAGEESRSPSSGLELAKLPGLEAEANALAGSDTIEFDISGGGSTATISPSTELPAITEAVTIDGTTQDCATPPCIELRGNGLTGDGLTLASGTTVRGLVINFFDGHGIRASGVSGVFVEGNFHDYEEDRKRRLGADAVSPKRMKYKKLAG